MANFVLLYSGGGGMAESEAEQAAVMQKWGAWFGEIGSSLVDGGNPFAAGAKSISRDGSVHDGPVGTLATGYSIISASSLDVAAGLVKGCPVLASGGQVTVYEIQPTM
jgi:hypothetical protein